MSSGRIHVGVETAEELFSRVLDVATDAVEDAFEPGDPEPSVVADSWLKQLKPPSGMSLSRGNWYGTFPQGTGFSTTA